MIEEVSQILTNFLSFLFFQKGFEAFAMGMGDPLWLMVSKRVLFFLPIAAIIVGIWASLFNVVSTLVRQKRHEFLTSLVITWWDLGKSIFSFWGGIFKFLFTLIASAFGLMKFLIVGVWAIIQDIFLVPFRMMGNLAGNALKPGIPWIAVILMLVWCALEGIIFTYIMSPLVIDTFSNLTGEQLGEGFVRIPLFFFMMFIVLGSYAVLANLTEAFKKKNIALIVKIASIELVALFVEVVFLYREFVDSLVPWFAQYASDDFQLGIFGTLAIASGAWLGIRGLSWFLFASAGTPTILAVIQRDGVRGAMLTPNQAANQMREKNLELSSNFSKTLHHEVEWLQAKGDELLGAFVLPPLQIIAASINFWTLFLSGKHLFALPFKNLNEILDSKDLLKAMHDLRSNQQIRTIHERGKDVSGIHQVPHTLAKGKTGNDVNYPITDKFILLKPSI